MKKLSWFAQNLHTIRRPGKRHRAVLCAIFSKYYLGLLLVGCVCVLLLGQRAFAIKPFQTEFLAMYAENSTDEGFKKSVEEAKCFVCHDPKKDPETGKASKKNRNRYGKELSKLLDKKKDKKDKEKIQESLKKVADMKVNPDDKDSKTYGELIKTGKLPGGDS